MSTPVSKRALHPIPAVLLAGTLPLFLGTLLSDWAYSSTYEVQWINFAAWLITGALVLMGVALLWGIIALFRAGIGRDRGAALYVLLLLAAFILGFINALVHGKDAWATMPTGLILSVVVFLCAFAATWLGFSADRAGAVR